MAMRSPAVRLTSPGPNDLVIRQKERILHIMNKLNDRHTQKAAAEDLLQMVKYLDASGFPQLMTSLCSTGSEQKVYARKECARAIGVMASELCPSRALAMQAPYLGKMLSQLKKGLTDVDSSVREVSSEALAMLAKGMHEAGNAPIAGCNPIMKVMTDCMADGKKELQAAACAALGMAAPFIGVLEPSFLKELIKKVNTTAFQAQHALLAAIGSLDVTTGQLTGLIKAHPDCFITLLPALIGHPAIPATASTGSGVLGGLASKDWFLRRASADLLRAASSLYGPLLEPEGCWDAGDPASVTSRCIRALDQFCNFDKVKEVRETAREALLLLEVLQQHGRQGMDIIGWRAYIEGLEKDRGLSPAAAPAPTPPRPPSLRVSTPHLVSRDMPLVPSSLAPTTRPISAISPAAPTTRPVSAISPSAPTARQRASPLRAPLRDPVRVSCQRQSSVNDRFQRARTKEDQVSDVGVRPQAVEMGSGSSRPFSCRASEDGEKRISYSGERVDHGGDGLSYSGGRVGYGGERVSYSGERVGHGGERVSYSGERVSYGGERASHGGERVSYGGESSVGVEAALAKLSLHQREVDLGHIDLTSCATGGEAEAAAEALTMQVALTQSGSMVTMTVDQWRSIQQRLRDMERRQRELFAVLDSVTDRSNKTISTLQDRVNTLEAQGRGRPHSPVRVSLDHDQLLLSMLPQSSWPTLLPERKARQSEGSGLGLAPPRSRPRTARFGSFSGPVTKLAEDASQAPPGLVMLVSPSPQGTLTHIQSESSSPKAMAAPISFSPQPPGIPVRPISSPHAAPVSAVSCSPKEPPMAGVDAAYAQAVAAADGRSGDMQLMRLMQRTGCVWGELRPETAVQLLKAFTARLLDGVMLTTILPWLWRLADEEQAHQLHLAEASRQQLLQALTKVASNLAGQDQRASDNVLLLAHTLQSHWSGNERAAGSPEKAAGGIEKASGVLSGMAPIWTSSGGSGRAPSRQTSGLGQAAGVAVDPSGTTPHQTSSSGSGMAAAAEVNPERHECGVGPAEQRRHQGLEPKLGALRDQLDAMQRGFLSSPHSSNGAAATEK